jgi:hypothetical protein
MGFNPEKEYQKIKELLKKEKQTKDIPLDTFGVAVMRILGTNKKVVAGRWIETFELFGFIRNKDDIINFIK